MPPGLPVSVPDVIRHLREHDGAVLPASRSLGISDDRLRGILRRHGLEHLPASLQEERQVRTYRETMDALLHHGGVVFRAAKELGIRQSSMVTRMRAMGLVEYASVNGDPQTYEIDRRRL